MIIRDFSMCSPRKSWIFARGDEILKDYYMSVYYHPGKATVVVDALRRLSKGIVAYVEEQMKELVKDYTGLLA